MPAIVISNYQADSGDIAPQVAECCAQRFGAAHVALLDQISPADQRALRSYQADVVLVLIGPHWAQQLTAPTGAATRRELSAFVFAPQPRLLLPLLVHGASMPDGEQLPPDVRPIATVQALAVRDGDAFPADMQAVIATIIEHFKQRAAAQRAQGNFIWFRILSLAPLGLLLVFGLAGGILNLSDPQHASPLQYAVLFPLATLLFLSMLALWPISLIIAITTRRVFWAIANGLMQPVSFVLPWLFYEDAAHLSASEALLSNILTLGMAIWLLFSWILWPIIFALTLPPYRNAARQVAKLNLGRNPA